MENQQPQNYLARQVNQTNLPLKKRLMFILYQQLQQFDQLEPLDLSNKTSIGKIRIPKCRECFRIFDGHDRLKNHVRRHDIKKSGRYTCETCNKPFVQQSSLITHRRIHTGEKPYKCKICNNSYGDLSTFTKHLRTHTGEKPYKCEFCDQRFSQSGNCLRHKRSVHARIFL